MPKGHPARYIERHGEILKECYGPSHLDGPEFVPISNFYIYKVAPKGKPGMLGKPRPWCKTCESFHKGCVPYIPLSRCRFILIELQHRLGKMETCRRLGMSQNWLWQVNNNRIRRLRRQTVIRAIDVLRECRAKNEVRHKKSILHGAYLRTGDKLGHSGVERIPSGNKADYYFAGGDAENERKKAEREMA